MNYWTYWSSVSSDKEFQAPHVVVFLCVVSFFPPRTAEKAQAPAFQSEGGNVLQREEPLQQNQERFRLLCSSQCGGFNQKSAL